MWGCEVRKSNKVIGYMRGVTYAPWSRGVAAGVAIFNCSEETHSCISLPTQLLMSPYSTGPCSVWQVQPQTVNWRKACHKQGCVSFRQCTDMYSVHLRSYSRSGRSAANNTTNIATTDSILARKLCRLNHVVQLQNPNLLFNICFMLIYIMLGRLHKTMLAKNYQKVNQLTTWE